MTSLVHSLKNDHRFDDLKLELADFAKQEGAGRGSKIRWGLRLLRAAYDGVVDLTKDKHGPGEDDALALCVDYAFQLRGADQFDTKGESERSAIRAAKAIIRCGGLAGLGNGEPQATVNNLMNERRMLRAKIPEKLDNAFITLVRFCRLQNKSPNVLINDPEDLRAICMKPAPKAKSVETKLKLIHRQVDKLIKGDGDLQFSCDELELAREGIKDAMKVFRRKDAQEAGVTVTDAEERIDNVVKQGQEALAEHILTASNSPPLPLGEDGLPPIVTMDDLEAQRAREEGETMPPLNPDDDEDETERETRDDDENEDEDEGDVLHA